VDWTSVISSQVQKGHRTNFWKEENVFKWDGRGLRDKWESIGIKCENLREARSVKARPGRDGKAGFAPN